MRSTMKLNLDFRLLFCTVLMISISSVGNTATLGSDADNGHAGAARVSKRTAGVWAQEGSKLVGSGAVGPAWQGAAVAISADGNTAIVGGWGDNHYAGAA